MKRPKPVLLLGVGFFAFVILAVALALHGGRPNDDLLTRATRVASVQHWPLGNGEVFSSDPYLWLSDHELFHFTYGGPPMCLDTQTGADTPTPGLASTASGHIVSASPDGQWVLWETGKWQNSPRILAATNRSSGRTVKWPEARDVWRDEGFWLPDSRRWVAINYLLTGQRIHGNSVAVRGMMIYSVDHPGVVKIPTPNDLGTSRILGVTPQDRVILADAISEQPITQGQPTQSLFLIERSLDPRRPQERQVQILQPDEHTDASGFRLSPQGDRLAWFFFSSRPSNPIAWLSLWTRHSYAGGRETLDIWVSRLDGSGPRKIGEITGSNVNFPGASCWTPDGKRISFVSNGTLYTVPVD